MKNKIFEEMRARGWNLGDYNLGDNTNENFEDVLGVHLDKMEYMLDECPGTGERRIDLPNWNAYIDNIEISQIFEFMSDMIRSINYLDYKESGVRK